MFSDKTGKHLFLYMFSDGDGELIGRFEPTASMKCVNVKALGECLYLDSGTLHETDAERGRDPLPDTL